MQNTNVRITSSET